MAVRMHSRSACKRLCFSALIGLVVGAVCVRLKEIYFSFLTLAFQMFLHSIILTWTSLTGVTRV